MINIDDRKDEMIQELSIKYSQNIINIEEYERMLEYINKIETNLEIKIIEKILHEINKDNKELIISPNNKIITNYKEKHLSLFSWKTSNLDLFNGNSGKYFSVFGTNRIIVNNLPKGKTILNVNSIFGLTEILVSKNIKIINKATPFLSGIFISNEVNVNEEDNPELYIFGKAIFGNITIKTIEENKKEEDHYKKFVEKAIEKKYNKL